ncbi:MAG TPA: choice-of-anchor D domain-containing protein [Candidatus Kapabacteria bacterium]|nr:choice-of-anchor D domain-containing protein [Candidatus Kapabacteria bacterium]
MVHRFTFFRSMMLLALLGFITSTASFAQMPKKKVVVEKQTGAWCQYCPGGIEAFEQIHEQYPEDAILMAYHQGDGMAITEQETIRAAGYWNGYPSATVNRSDAIATHPATVAGNIGNYMGRTSIVDVRLKSVNFNAGSRSLQVEVEARFFANHTGEKRFNLIVIEDSVTGSGQPFDQVNAYNNTVGSKWYKKGNPIKNFYHRHVVRKLLGGAWGAANSLPNSVQAGDVKTYTFSSKLDNTWKPEKMYLVAMVAEFDNDGTKPRTILNAEEERLTVRSARAELSMSKPYNVIKPSEVIEKIITVKNTNAMELTYDLEIDEDNSSYPGDWTAELGATDVKIAAGKSADVTVKITAGSSFSMAELGKVIVKATPRAKAGIDPRENSVTVFALTNNAKYLTTQIGGFVNWGDDYANLMSESPAYGNGILRASWQEAEPLIANFKDQFDGYSFQISGGIVTQTGVIAPAPLAAKSATYPNIALLVTDLLAQGKSVFLSAPRSLWWASNDPNAAEGKVPEAVNFFKDILKIEFVQSIARFTVSGNTYSLTKFNVAGIEGNPISNAVNGLGNNTFSNYTMYTDILKLSTGSTSVPLFTTDNKATNIVGVSYENDKKGRMVFLTVPVEAFDNAFTRSTFISKSWDWLLEGKIQKPKTAKIAASVGSVDFKEVAVNTEADVKFDIMNEGEIPLVISDIVLDGSNPEAFTMDKGTLPLSIEPGQKKEFSIKFKPTQEKIYLATLQFTSNSDGEEINNMSLTIEGKGISNAPKPSVLKTTDSKVSFGSVAVGTANKILKLRNSSTQAITIKDIKFEGKDAANFSIIDKQDIIPSNIELPFNIGFTSDKAGSYAATMTITSTLDDNSQDVFTIEVSATAIASGIEEDAVSETMAISVGPNPAAVQSMVSFTLGGNAPQTVGIDIVDINGAVVMPLFNGVLAAGQHPLAIAADKLATGSYRVVARTGTERVSVPLMIVR